MLSQLMHHSEGSYVRSFQKFFMNLPLACLVGRDILAVHGGISPKLRSLQVCYSEGPQLPMKM
ncbi:hypothetical protein COOONC_26238 [Cooperia oncophora]